MIEDGRKGRKLRLLKSVENDYVLEIRRWLNGPLKHSKIKSLQHTHQVVVLSILETKIREENLFNVWNKLRNPSWNFVYNYWILFYVSKVQLAII